MVDIDIGDNGYQRLETHTSATQWSISSQTKMRVTLFLHTDSAEKSGSGPLYQLGETWVSKTHVTFCRTSEIEGKEGSRTAAPSSCSQNIQPFLPPQVVSVEMIFSLDYLVYFPRMPLASRARVYADVNSHRLQSMQGTGWMEECSIFFMPILPDPENTGTMRRMWLSGATRQTDSKTMRLNNKMQ